MTDDFKEMCLKVNRNKCPWCGCTSMYLTKLTKERLSYEDVVTDVEYSIKCIMCENERIDRDVKKLMERLGVE